MESSIRLIGSHTPVAALEAEWPAGAVRLSGYLGTAELPTEIPGRVRCLVTNGDSVLVTWDPAGNPDCFPGGGAESGETVAETARREVWEETGWHIDVETIEVLGWMHLESLVEMDPGFPFPHPDSFMTVVRVAASHPETPDEPWADVDGFIARSAFVRLVDLPDEILANPVQLAFLDRAFGTGWRSPTVSSPTRS